MVKMGRKKIKQYKSKRSYRKFLAYIHIRTPSGRKAKHPSQTISAKTPLSRKEKVVKVGGKIHRPVLGAKAK